jgi:EAL domain-containing protein (putative c-di-GMP-specific phosphodiesterase class I)/DNA-binding response OmpR family regulator
MTAVGKPGDATLRSEPAVLVVDDDPDLLSLLVVALGRAGLRAVKSPSAEAALDVIAADHIGCIVADLGMPGMNGIDFVRVLRGQPETSTLPFILMTGSGDGDSVIEALDAGADDFLPKPVRLDELIARVRAHLRTQAAWSEVVTGELRTRADAIQAIGQLALSSVPEEAAEAVVTELARRIGSEFVGVFRFAGEARLEPLARWNEADGVVIGGPPLTLARSQLLIRRAREGPWVERVSEPGPGEPNEPKDAFWDVHPDIAAGAPIYSGDDLVGILNIAVVIHARTAPPSMLQARLLASVIDYASVLGVVAGPAIADRRQSAKETASLRQVLVDRAFLPVYQPIVSLRSGRVVGYEALTRFADGTPPDERFARAAAVGLSFEFELAAIEAAIASAPPIAVDGFLSLNVSPGLVVSARRLRSVLEKWPGRVVLEVTEHAPIANYEGFRRAMGRLGRVELAIDDAGAGYASLRHILELGPTWVKLDITLVRGIDADPLRQALVAGLAHFATRTGERLIAEGVERQEEADALLDIGVEFAQGYLFGRPEPRPE